MTGAMVDHPVVGAYLAQLDAAALAAGLPAGRRAELRAEIIAHIDDALSGAPQPPGDPAVADVLDRLGPVEDIVAAEAGVPGVRAGGWSAPAPLPSPSARSAAPAVLAVLAVVAVAVVLVLVAGLWLFGAGGSSEPVPAEPAGVTTYEPTAPPSSAAWSQDPPPRVSAGEPQPTATSAVPSTTAGG